MYSSMYNMYNIKSKPRKTLRKNTKGKKSKMNGRTPIRIPMCTYDSRVSPDSIVDEDQSQTMARLTTSHQPVDGSKRNKSHSSHKYSPALITVSELVHARVTVSAPEHVPAHTPVNVPERVLAPANVPAPVTVWAPAYDLAPAPAPVSTVYSASLEDSSEEDSVQRRQRVKQYKHPSERNRKLICEAMVPLCKELFIEFGDVSDDNSDSSDGAQCKSPRNKTNNINNAQMGDDVPSQNETEEQEESVTHLHHIALQANIRLYTKAVQIQRDGDVYSVIPGVVIPDELKTPKEKMAFLEYKLASFKRQKQFLKDQNVAETERPVDATQSTSNALQRPDDNDSIEGHRFAMSPATNAQQTSTATICANTARRETDEKLTGIPDAGKTDTLGPDHVAAITKNVMVTTTLGQLANDVTEELRTLRGGLKHPDSRSNGTTTKQDLRSHEASNVQKNITALNPLLQGAPGIVSPFRDSKSAAEEQPVCHESFIETEPERKPSRVRKMLNRIQNTLSIFPRLYNTNNVENFDGDN